MRALRDAFFTQPRRAVSDIKFVICPHCHSRIHLPIVEPGVVAECLVCRATTKVTRAMLAHSDEALREKLALPEEVESEAPEALAPGVPPTATGHAGTTPALPIKALSGRDVVRALEAVADSSLTKVPEDVKPEFRDERVLVVEGVPAVPPDAEALQVSRDAAPTAGSNAGGVAHAAKAAHGSGPISEGAAAIVHSAHPHLATAAPAATAATPSPRVKLSSSRALITTRNYHEEHLARLAVDLGQLGRTRGLMAGMLLLVAGLLPLQLVTHMAPPGFDAVTQTIGWEEFSVPPKDAVFTNVPTRTWTPHALHWLYLLGLPLVGALTLAASKWAHYIRRARLFVGYSLLALVALWANPFSNADAHAAPCGLYDPLTRFPDALLFLLIGAQIGHVSVLRHFADYTSIRVAAWITSGLLLLVGLSMMLRADFTEFGVRLPGVAAIVVALWFTLVAGPVWQIGRPTPGTSLVVGGLSMTLLFVLPLFVFFSLGRQAVGPLTVIKHTFGLEGALILIGIAVAEVFHRRLLAKKATRELSAANHAWNSPYFMRLRLQVQLESREINRVQYKAESARIGAIEKALAAQVRNAEPPTNAGGGS